MSLKLCLGISKKLGLPRYSSLGVSCQLEVELPSGILAMDPETLEAELRHVYDVCNVAVDDQLARCREDSAQHELAGPATQDGAAGVSGDGNGSCHTAFHGNGHAPIPPSARQVGYIRTLAGRIPGLGEGLLEVLCQQVCDRRLTASMVAPRCLPVRCASRQLKLPQECGRLSSRVRVSLSVVHALICSGTSGYRRMY